MARDTIILTRTQIKQGIGLDQVIPAIATCLAEHEEGGDLLPPKLILEIGGGIAACLAGYTRAQHALTMKLGQERKANVERGLPTIHAHVSLYDPDTGELLMICEGVLPTMMRTAAAAAVAADKLARPEASVCCVIGCGQLGRQALEAVYQVRRIEQLYLCDARREAALGMAGFLNRVWDLNVEATDPEQAVPQADIVVTCTNSTEPIVRSEWVRPGTHLSCMGADLADKQEVEIELLPRCRLYADSIEQCVTRGEVSKAVAAGVLPEQPFVGTLGQLLNGEVPGRQSDEEVTLYDGTGLGVQDTAVAAIIYEIAEREGLGTRVDWLA